MHVQQDNPSIMTKIMPEQKPGRSKQNYSTPQAFVTAVEKRFGKIVCDLAAEPENAKSTVYLTEQDNSLSQPWAELYPENNLWLNPPYSNIGKWAEKCYVESQKRCGSILLLIPASVGSNYFADFINKKAMVLTLNPRLVFGGEKNVFPKDLMLCIYSNGLSGFDVWRWKQ